MKIAFFVADYPNPSETFVARQIAGMRALGHDVTIVAGCLKAPMDEIEREGVKVRLIRQESTGIRALTLRLRCGVMALLNWRRLGAIIRGLAMQSLMPAADLLSCPLHLGSYDAIVAHFGPMGVRAAILRQAGMLGGPLAVIFHGKDMSDRWTLKRFLPSYRNLFRSAELLLPISRLWRQRLIDWGAPVGKIRVLRMGVDLGLFDPVPDDKPLQRPLRVLSVARLVEKKGLAYAIEGVKQAAADIDYRIIGYGPLEETLTERCAAPGNNVRLLGRRSHADVFAELRATDIFLLPSVTAEDGDMEGIPVALMEAMAMGVLVVATRHSGIPELIEDELEGLLVTERDANAIAHALDRIADGAIDIAAMRRAARAKVEREFNNSLLDHDLEALLATLQPEADQPRAVADSAATPRSLRA
ncbi:colanic acid biosynthesis glycosyltransferase WcaL [Sphingobium sp. SCG-1]|uniref:glycosyltransferase n=1 Tax=Sphingobium sp. SCG-1 TaxID=2072936 RepID=UPI000CD69F18|nr:glycosyltransferase [Sphingobium sp. SCG-1]AUW58808.1 colanic acid biosynthesis glycosyltransferase WcaL [Sphingobium sp. SCG-1]